MEVRLPPQELVGVVVDSKGCSNERESSLSQASLLVSSRAMRYADPVEFIPGRVGAVSLLQGQKVLCDDKECRSHRLDHTSAGKPEHD